MSRSTLPVKCLDGSTGWIEIDQTRTYTAADTDGTKTLCGVRNRWFHYSELLPGHIGDVKELTPEGALQWILQAGLPIPAELSELAERTRIR